MKKILCLMVVLAVTSGAPAWTQNLTASLAQIPGLADSPESGAFVDLVRAIDEFYPAGRISIQVAPFARSVSNVLRGDADFHIPSFVNPDVPDDVLPFGRVPEPLGQVTLVIYSNVNNPISREDIEEAHAAGGRFPYVIEVGSGLEVNFPFPTVGSNDIEQSLRKVNAGRIHAYLWPPEGDFIVREHRMGRIHREVLADFDDVILVAKTPGGAEVAALLDTVLKEMSRQGQLKQYHDPFHLEYEEWQPHQMGW